VLQVNISIKLHWRGDDFDGVDDFDDFPDVEDFEGVDDFDEANDFRGVGVFVFATFDSGDFDGVACDLDGVNDLSDDPRSFDGVPTESLDGEEADADVK